MFLVVFTLLPFLYVQNIFDFSDLSLGQQYSEVFLHMIASRCSEIFRGQSDPIDSPCAFDSHYTEQTDGFNFIKQLVPSIQCHLLKVGLQK